MSRLLGHLWNWMYPPPPTPPLYQEPWRDTSDLDIATLKKDVMEKDVEKKINLLILGPLGAGKSSFINSIMSICKNRHYNLAPTYFNTTKTWTVKLEAYDCWNLRLFDCAGVSLSDEHGFPIDDFLFFIKGNIKAGYEFDRERSIRQIAEEGNPLFNKTPSLDDEMHCVIFIVDSTSFNAMTKNNISNNAHILPKKIEKLQANLCEQVIPRILILTKVDKICDEVANDINNVFRSRKVKQIVKQASEIFGIEEASIHPVKNYVNTFGILNEMNIPLLIALRQAKQYADDRIEHVLQERERNQQTIS